MDWRDCPLWYLLSEIDFGKIVYWGLFPNFENLGFVLVFVLKKDVLGDSEIY